MNARGSGLITRRSPACRGTTLRGGAPGAGQGVEGVRGSGQPVDRLREVVEPHVAVERSLDHLQRAPRRHGGGARSVERAPARHERGLPQDLRERSPGWRRGPARRPKRPTTGSRGRSRDLPAASAHARAEGLRIEQGSGRPPDTPGQASQPDPFAAGQNDSTQRAAGGDGWSRLAERIEI